jgi:8-amino-7-oxononanoate synthase
MNSFDGNLSRLLTSLRDQGLRRELRRVDSPQGPRIKIGGQTLLNFSSNDYLGLANDPQLKEAAIAAVAKFGTGSGASRLVCGSLAPHHELEETLATFKHTEAALTFSTGYAAALGAICALVSRHDIIVLDKLVHASIVDAARLSGAKIRVLGHNDLDDLENILKWADGHSRITDHAARPLIVTESIFSMDGDAAPLGEIVALKEKYGAWLMVDEAHATGIRGSHGRGLADELGIGDRIEIQMGTLGKAFGSSGGYICGSRVLIDFLVNRARSFIFSTAPPPSAAAAARAAIEFIQSSEGETRRTTLRELVSRLQSAFGDRQPPIPGAIIPFIIGDEMRTVDAAATLREKGIYVPAIRYPAVSRGLARLRVTLTAGHTTEEINRLAAALNKIVNRKSQIPNPDAPACPT